MEEVYTEFERRNIATVCGHVIQKAMGNKDFKTTMIYVDVAKPHIQEQLAKLDRIPLPPLQYGCPSHPTEPGVGEQLCLYTDSFN